jgi:sirohydrochlorin ferrochelatase
MPKPTRQPKRKSHQTGVIVFTHGSVLPEANDVLKEFVLKLRRHLRTNLIEPCFMDLAQPDIPAAVRALVAQGCDHIFGYSLFLVPGQHLSQDIPRIIERELKNHPGVTYDLSPPMMANSDLIDFVADRIAPKLPRKGSD